MNPFVSLGMLHARADWSILTNRICYYSNHCANWVSGSLSHTTAQIWCKQKQIKGRVGTEVPIAWFICNKKNITFWYITWKWMCESLNLIGNITDEMYVCVCVCLKCTLHHTLRDVCRPTEAKLEWVEHFCECLRGKRCVCETEA